jgi:hypothetical protein
MYSWAGQDRFEDRDLFHIVGDGALSTGSFASMLASIFGGDLARFSYNGGQHINGTAVSEFGFRIPRDKSRYLYVFGHDLDQQTSTGYDGAVFAEARSSDLVRLTIRTAQLPPETGACEVSQTLDYGRVELNGGEFLLPIDATVSVIHPDGSQAENRIRYSGCREFRGESSVHFDEPEVAASASKNSVAPVGRHAPAGLPFKVVITENIDPATAAAGDVVKGRLKTPIRDQEKTLVPEGAVVTGRLTRVRRSYQPRTAAMWKEDANRTIQPSLAVGLRLETVEIEGRSFPLVASFDAGVRSFASKDGGLRVRVDIGHAESRQDRSVGIFEFWDGNPNRVVKSGWESRWVTDGR